MPWKPPRRPPSGGAAPPAERDRSPVAAAKSVPGRDEFSAPWRGHGRTCAVPEGRRRRLAGGKSAAADAAPGNRSVWLVAPAGHRRTIPGCRTTTGVAICPRRLPVAEMLGEDQRKEFLRCPAGARPVRRGNRGPRPLARACPRLISCGVPPGRGARPWRQFSGDRLAASPTRRHFLPFHSPAPNSPAQLGWAHKRVRPTPPARSAVCLRVGHSLRHLCETRVRRIRCNSAALCPSHPCDPSSAAQLNRPC